jgi:hypothetical protein
MSCRKYVLDGHVPRQEMNLIVWAKWFHHADRRVAYTPRSPFGGSISGDVITQFLSIEPLWPVLADWEMPLLFETAVWGGPWHAWSQNVATWEEAEALHAKVVQALKAGKPAGEFV